MRLEATTGTTSIGGRLRVRSLAAWLAVLALVFQSLVPLLHHPARVSTGDGLLRDLLVLCTPAGMVKAAPGDASGTPIAPGKVPHCPACFVHQLAGLPPPAVLLVAPRVPAIRLATAAPTDDAPLSPTYSPVLPRAPPAHA